MVGTSSTECIYWLLEDLLLLGGEGGIRRCSVERGSHVARGVLMLLGGSTAVEEFVYCC